MCTQSLLSLKKMIKCVTYLNFTDFFPTVENHGCIDREAAFELVMDVAFLSVLYKKSISFYVYGFLIKERKH